LPLALLTPWLLLVPAACALGFVLADVALTRFVARTKGIGFLLWFTAVHFTVQLALVAGAFSGAVRWLVDPRFGPSIRRRAARDLIGDPQPEGSAAVAP